MTDSRLAADDKQIHRPADQNQQTQVRVQTDSAGLKTVAPAQTTPQAPSFKEAKEVSGLTFQETEPKVVEQKEFEIPKEVTPWVEKETKEETHLPIPIEDEYGQVLLEAAHPPRPKIVLPLDDQQMKKGAKKKITESIRWLVVWCLRIIKMFPQRVIYGSASRSK